MDEKKPESRLEKVVFELGRGLMFGGLAATIFRQNIHTAYPLAALLLGGALLLIYIWKEKKS